MPLILPDTASVLGFNRFCLMLMPMSALSNAPWCNPIKTAFLFSSYAPYHGYLRKGYNPLDYYWRTDTKIILLNSVNKKNTVLLLLLYLRLYLKNKYMVTKLTPHFTLNELIVTKTGLSNVPNEFCINNLRVLCRDILEPIREKIGIPLIVNSGFRSFAVNKAVGGVDSSQHLLGQAADIIAPNYIDSLSHVHLFNLISNMVVNGVFNVGQCILYRKSHFVHVSLPTSTHKNEFIIRNK